jgi:hypothetical protein
MRYIPNTGHVYFIEGYTAPKVFNGLYFECLLTDQKISAHIRIRKDLGHLLEWKHEIYKPERFGIVDRTIKH